MHGGARRAEDGAAQVELGEVPAECVIGAFLMGLDWCDCMYVLWTLAVVVLVS